MATELAESPFSRTHYKAISIGGSLPDAEDFEAADARAMPAVSESDEADAEPLRILPSPRPPEPRMVAANMTSESRRSEPTTLGQELHEPEDLIRLSASTTSPARTFQVLQQWEGIVHAVNGDYFVAELSDLTSPGNPAEMAEFPLAEIAAADRPIFLPGTAFYWVIGYERRPGGQILRVSEIRVRRNPVWSQAKLDLIKAEALARFEQISQNVVAGPQA